MAAIDYRALRHAGSVDTLLYVAHRREILDQARRMFRNALQMPGFGELLY
jgi:superfamily II DNA or RNA helicase